MALTDAAAAFDSLAPARASTVARPLKAQSRTQIASNWRARGPSERPELLTPTLPENATVAGAVLLHYFAGQYVRAQTTSGSRKERPADESAKA